MKTQVINEPMDNYLARSDYISASDVKNLSTSPALYHYWKTHQKEDTPSTAFGTIVHSAILETEDFKNRVVERIDARANSKAYKDWFEKLPGDAIILSSKDCERLTHICRNVEKSGLCKLIDADDGEAERTVLYEDDAGLKLRCRPDYMSKSRKMIVDLKTTTDLEWFPRDAKKFGYPVSVAHYKKIMAAHWACEPEEIDYVFLAVQTSAPFDCDWFVLADETETSATERWQSTIDNWAELAAKTTGRVSDEPRQI